MSSSSHLSADYLVIGAGALGVAFCDTLLLSNPKATILLVDRNDRPGGHWIYAYPFVCLHQPAANYGVESMELSSGTVDKTGTNKGLEALATGQEIEGYLKRAVFKMEGTGRVKFLPMHEWNADARVLRNMVTNQTVNVTYTKIVLANYNTTVTSAMRPPPWHTEPGVRCIPSRELPTAAASSPPPSRFCVIGGGKTSMDCIVWLQEHGVDPNKITWVIPRDWFAVNRDATQVAQNRAMGAALYNAQRKATEKATSFDEALRGMLECGFLVKLDSAPELPTMNHGAVVSRAELKLLNQVKDIERRGRITLIDSRGYTLENGTTREMPEGTLYIDCAASTVKAKPQVPIYQPGMIVIPFLSAGIPCFNAAFIARLESYSPSDALKNSILRPSAFPDLPHETFSGNHIAADNLANIFAVPELAKWVLSCRLSPTGPPEQRGKITDKEIKVMSKAFEKRREAVERLIKIEAGKGNTLAVEYLKGVDERKLARARL